jgi:mono/diheme cytochrome c family protein
MRGLLTGIGIGVAIVLAATLGALRWLDMRVQATLARTYDIPLVEVAIPSDSASLAQGERFAWFHGCHGCHDAQLQGKVFVDEPRVMRVVAPNITEAITRYSDAELARLIRHGVRRDGSGVLAMPSATFYHIGDAELGAIIAHLRRAPVVTSRLPYSELRLLAKVAVFRGELLPDAATIDHGATRLGNRADTSAAWRGEYLARTICGECHGPTLHGDLEAPPLVRAMGYSAPQFVSLMLDGRSRDGRELPLMGRTARARFVRFTEGEIAAIYGYLMRMPAVAAGEAR